MKRYIIRKNSAELSALGRHVSEVINAGAANLESAQVKALPKKKKRGPRMYRTFLYRDVTFFISLKDKDQPHISIIREGIVEPIVSVAKEDMMKAIRAIAKVVLNETELSKLGGKDDTPEHPMNP